MRNVTYLDHAASSFPKPEAVIGTLSDYLRNVAISPHHSSHVLSQKAGDIIKKAKDNIANFMGCKTPENILYTQSATFAINQVLLGFLKLGDHVIYSSLEHNAVVRPLKLLETKGVITTDIWQSDNLGHLDLNAIPFKDNTRLLLVSHSSNLNGKIQPVKEIVEIAHKRSVLVGIDASQSMGFIMSPEI